MHIFSTKKVLIFRLYTLIFCIIGMFYLFKTSFFITKSFYASLTITLFALLSPTFSFYSFATLPSPIALSILFIAAFHFTRYLTLFSNTHFYYSLFLLTFASLIRFPFIIYLFALVCLFSISILFKKRKHWKELFLTFIGIAVVFAYFAYNKFYLAKYFGSNFLSHANPATSIKDLLDIVFYSFYHQSWRYFTLSHYILLLITITIFFKNRSKKLNINYPLITYLIIVAIGFLLYTILMLNQFREHDYYILDTLFPILLFFLIASFFYLEPKHLQKLKKISVLFGIFSIILAVPSLIYGFDPRINGDFYKNRITFVNAHQTLDSLGISKKAKILLLDSNTPNLNLIGLQRKGYSVMFPSKQYIERALTWDFDYIITSNNSLEKNIIPNYPNFENETKVFFSNKAFTIHLKK